MLLRSCLAFLKLEHHKIRTRERKSKNLFLIGYVSLMILLMIMSSCGTSQLTQKQVKINYELDKLWIDYKYESDSLINEFYKK